MVNGAKWPTIRLKMLLCCQLYWLSVLSNSTGNRYSKTTEPQHQEPLLPSPKKRSNFKKPEAGVGLELIKYSLSTFHADGLIKLQLIFVTLL